METLLYAIYFDKNRLFDEKNIKQGKEGVKEKQ
jgi:hypothetical protein